MSADIVSPIDPESTAVTTASDLMQPSLNALRRFDTAEAESFNQIFRHSGDGIALEWNARNHRKQRSHPLRAEAGPVGRRHRYRLLSAQWRSLSWWVAATFTLGSLFWLVNGLTIVFPIPDAARLDAAIPAWTAVIGGGIFVVGAYLSWLEVLNAPRYVLLFTDTDGPHSRPVHAEDHRFRWFGWRPPSWGLGLNLVQMLGASIFFVPCIIGTLLGSHPQIDAFAWYWLPQMIGASCFLVAAWMAMREVQTGPIRPAPGKLGWWSGLFNLFGAVGFFLCAWFGFESQFQNQTASDLTTLIGSICFLIASELMLIEISNPEGPEAHG